ncbi:MAG: ribbon-helix-helix domain-containing protein [Alphaproteobacteria bacterium]|nr:ribbon-helix-helix domain-containing protein [Alphaproteobacteria bacterium]
MKKRSVNILGHQTSVTLEDEFWDALKDEVQRAGLSMNKLIAQIDETRRPEDVNLSSALRVFVLKSLQERL